MIYLGLVSWFYGSKRWCSYLLFAPGLMLYSHWLSPGLGQGPGPEPGRMSCMVLRRTFHTAPEQQQGPEQGQGKMGFSSPETVGVVCFNDISMAFRCPVLAPDTASVNGFCIILVPVPVPVPVTASVNTP